MRVTSTSRSAQADATCCEAQSAPQCSARLSMYGIWSASWAAHSRSSQPFRVLASAAAPVTTGTSCSIAWWTAVPIAPEELSTCSSAGETRSRKVTAPSAPSNGSRRATPLISVTACFTRWTAGWDLQPKACRLKRALNSQRYGSGPLTCQSPSPGRLHPQPQLVSVAARARCSPAREVGWHCVGTRYHMLRVRSRPCGRSSRPRGGALLPARGSARGHPGPGGPSTPK